MISVWAITGCHRQIMQTRVNISCPEHATLVPFPLGREQSCEAELSAGMRWKEKAFRRDGDVCIRVSFSN